MAENQNKIESRRNEPGAWIDIVQNHVGTLKFGVVQITVHEGRVVQIERTEKVRLDKDTY